MSFSPPQRARGTFIHGGKGTRCSSRRILEQDCRCLRAKAQQARVPSGWAETTSDGEGRVVDRLRNLGQAQNYNINVDHGQTSDHLDSIFTGGFLGRKSDIADGSLRHDEFRTYNNIVGDYYVAPRFLMRVAMHTAKNYLADHLRSVKVPLIMGIWGPKGTGKTFQTELSFKKMKMEAVVMSSGELESETAGRPGQLIRSRYRKAADMSKVRGVMSALLVNDIDAGLGRFEVFSVVHPARDFGEQVLKIGLNNSGTQCTVNNQIVVSTLMNMCDHPNHVSIGEVWRPERMNIRIPIFVTGNDFSTLYAPLVRDGRMDKSRKLAYPFLLRQREALKGGSRFVMGLVAFRMLDQGVFETYYWVPDAEEKTAMVYQMYKDDNLSYEDIQQLIQRFGNQTLDFFGAIRAGTYDSQILDWIHREIVSDDITKDGNLKKISQRLLAKSELPQFEPVNLNLDTLVEEGERLVYEQEMVNSLRLSDEYIIKQHGAGSMLGFGG